MLFSSCLQFKMLATKLSLLDKAFHWFLAFPGSRFFAIDHIRKRPKGWTLFESLKKFWKSFSGIRREVSKHCSKLSIETELLCSFAMPNSIDVPSCLLLLRSCLVTKPFSNGYFLIQNSFCSFPRLQGFRFLPYALMFYKQHIFLNLASVFLNFFINWISSVGWVLLNTYKHHHTEVYVSPCIDVGLFTSYLCDLFFFFTFIILNHIISLK